MDLVRRTFSLLAVSGSIIDLKSLVNCVTLVPTSPAPIRMTMLLGRRAPEPVFAGVSLLGTCVLFFFLGLAISEAGQDLG